MKHLLKSKLLLSLTAFIMIAAAIAISLSGHNIPSHAALSTSQASSGWQLQELWHTAVESPSQLGLIGANCDGQYSVSDLTSASSTIYGTFLYQGICGAQPPNLTYGFNETTGAAVWRQNNDAGWQAPLVSSGIFVGEDVYKFTGNVALQAYDAVNDQIPQLWGNIGTIATINNGAVYVQNSNFSNSGPVGSIYSYDLKTGQIKWQNTNDVCFGGPGLGAVVKIEVYNGVVYYIGCQNTGGTSVQARSILDGSLLWSKNISSSFSTYGLPGLVPSFNSTLISNGSIYVVTSTTDGSNNPTISSFSTTDGTQNWSKTLSDTPSNGCLTNNCTFIGQVIASGSTVYVLEDISYNHDQSLLPSVDIYALNALSGSEIWRKSINLNANITNLNNGGNNTYHGTLVNNVLYFNLANAIYAFDAASGNQLMMDNTVAVNSSRQPISTPLVVGDTMYLTGINNGQFTIFAYKIIRSCQLTLTPPQPVGAPKLTQLSCDPYTDIDPTSQHQTEVEPDTFSFGSIIVSAFQVGRFSDGGSDNIGWATSTDGGTTWTYGFLPGTTQFATQPGVYERASDPSVAYDSKDGVWMISWLGIDAGKGKAVLVSLSPDGVNWKILPVTITTGVSLDKNWTVCDNGSSSFSGHCYTEWDDLSGVQSDNTCPKDPCGLIQMSTSTNGGQQWLPALSTAKSAHGLGGQPLVQPNGTVIVPYEGVCGFSLLDYCLTTHILAFTSLDGGVSWNEPKQIGSVQFHQPAGNLRAGSAPSAEIDKSGTVYVVWSDCRFEGLLCSANDIVMSTLTGVDPKNGTTKWSPVKRIPIDSQGSGVDHFIPGLAVDNSTSGSSAHLALTYYYYPVANCYSTCELDVGYISSIDGGNHWSSFTQLAGPMILSWLAQTDQGAMVGDYISTSISEGIAHPVFAVANAPAGSLLNEAVFTLGEQVRGPA